MAADTSSEASKKMQDKFRSSVSVAKCNFFRVYVKQIEGPDNSSHQHILICKNIQHLSSNFTLNSVLLHSFLTKKKP